MFLEHVQTRVDGRSNYFWICTPSSTPDFGPRGGVQILAVLAARDREATGGAWSELTSALHTPPDPLGQARPRGMSMHLYL